ncbi:reticulon-like protein B17 isoform X2 [Rhodamnia argentea]|uniref:Reticulon-like protein n=1 Tax=Rhodamnia argentea TaxID=178133 RepID=A0A8B8N1T3_9MYRT|nr:reticulon-like protein B17 isoform X2 [Rhodamnia argentea]
MDSTPLSHRSRTKSVSRLARVVDSSIETDGSLNLSLDLVPSSPRKIPSPSPSPLSLRSSNNSLPLRELLLLSPSPHKRSKTRLADRLEAADEPGEGRGAAAALRKRCKRREGQAGILACASPRSNRRSRRRAEVEGREERDLGLIEEAVKQRRKQVGRSRKERLSLVPLVNTSSSLSLSVEIDDGDNGNLDQIGQAIADLIMWRDVAKSTLWFGLGSLCFLSSCFAQGISFSIFSAICQLGLLFLGLSFFSNSICQRNNVEKRRDFQLKEDDILRVARLILPAANLAISKTRELFSGEPSMTLKVAPFLLLGAEYGHLITLWRLCAIGFFISFTTPKLYSRYAARISQKVEWSKWWVLEAWGACSHKKIVAASAIMAFWNLTTIKTRLLTAFISVVILRYHRQHSAANLEVAAEAEREDLAEKQPHKALVVAEKVSGD